MPAPPVARWASRTRRGGRPRCGSAPGTGAAIGPACCKGCGQRRARKTPTSSSSDVMSVQRRAMVSFNGNVELDSTSLSQKMRSTRCIQCDVVEHSSRKFAACVIMEVNHFQALQWHRKHATWPPPKPSLSIEPLLLRRVWSTLSTGQAKST